ncbi:esterase [Bacillus niameyensis]|uniref:esterase n=1 Tax=Bacillus niameyensis TaxID=1522308 RepID=UPI000781E901|nr:esterase [Bacillus niameyensis]
MIEIHNESIEDIPILHIVKDENKNKTLPLIIFVHGFTSAKEHNLHFAYLLAEKGFRIILPDTMLHGERAGNQNPKETMYYFWKIVVQTISELEVLKTHFVEKKLVDPEKIGLVGTSMGAIVTFGALTQYKWIKVAVSLMGSPYYEKFARAQIEHLKKAGVQMPFSDEDLETEFVALRPFDLTAQPGLLSERPLLIWHGEQDPVVPFQPTFDFYQQLQEHYKNHPNDIDFIVDEHAGHKVSREALLRTVAWFDNYLIENDKK